MVKECKNTDAFTDLPPTMELKALTVRIFFQELFAVLTIIRLLPFVTETSFTLLVARPPPHFPLSSIMCARAISVLRWKRATKCQWWLDALLAPTQPAPTRWCPSHPAHHANTKHKTWPTHKCKHTIESQVTYSRRQDFDKPRSNNVTTQVLRGRVSLYAVHEPVCCLDRLLQGGGGRCERERKNLTSKRYA